VTHTLPLLLALAFNSDPAAALPDAEAVEAPDFAGLTLGRAARLEGRRALYRVRVLAPFGPDGAPGVRHAVFAPGGRFGELRLPALARGDALTVEAELRLEYVPSKIGEDGAPAPASWRYHLERAVRRDA
jgi:hypothetical protein